MRIINVSIVIGPLMLIGALPASAGQPGRSDPPIQLAAGTDSPADRDSYTHEAQQQMQEWQRKLHDFDENAKAKGIEASDAAERELNKAATKADAASRDLQTAGAEEWESARVSFEHATRDLTDAWHKANPEDK